MTTTVHTRTARRGKAFRVASVATAGVGIAVAGAGVAFAAPASSVGQVVHGAASAVGLEWALPAGYTQAQYDKFWDAGYSAEDLDQLEALWKLDETQTKSRAGQALLDGAALPFAPGTYTAPAPTAEELAPYEAAIEAGYNETDLAQLGDLWNTDFLETKARVGELLLAGEDVPVAPTGIEVPEAPAAVPGK